ncbi:hypothetical protein LguiA_032942 [Lonicera macranthoides]
MLISTLAFALISIITGFGIVILFAAFRILIKLTAIIIASTAPSSTSTSTPASRVRGIRKGRSL